MNSRSIANALNDPRFADACKRVKAAGESYLAEKLATPEGRQQLRQMIEEAESKESLACAVQRYAITYHANESAPPGLSGRATQVVLENAMTLVRAAAQREYGKVGKVADPTTEAQILSAKQAWQELSDALMRDISPYIRDDSVSNCESAKASKPNIRKLIMRYLRLRGEATGFDHPRDTPYLLYALSTLEEEK